MSSLHLLSVLFFKKKVIKPTALTILIAQFYSNKMFKNVLDSKIFQDWVPYHLHLDVLALKLKKSLEPISIAFAACLLQKQIPLELQ